MRSLNRVLLILLSLVSISCAVNVPNVEVCGRLRVGAVCSYTLDGPNSRMSEEQWIDVRLGRISMTPEAYGEIKKFILIVCEKYDKCEMKEVIESIARLEDVL